MSEKKNLIVPKLQKQNLGKVNPQKAEYLYISKEFCKEGLSQIMQRSTQRGHGAGSTKEKYPLNTSQTKSTTL